MPVVSVDVSCDRELEVPVVSVDVGCDRELEVPVHVVSVDVGCDRELEVPVVSVDIGCDDVGCEGRMCEWVWGQIQSCLVLSTGLA